MSRFASSCSWLLEASASASLQTLASETKTIRALSEVCSAAATAAAADGEAVAGGGDGGEEVEGVGGMAARVINGGGGGGKVQPEKLRSGGEGAWERNTAEGRHCRRKGGVRMRGLSGEHDGRSSCQWCAS